MALAIAEFRETIKIREEKFKDIPEKQGVLALLKRLYEKETMEFWPQQYKESLSIQTNYTGGKINLRLPFTSIEQDLWCTTIVFINFKEITYIICDCLFTCDLSRTQKVRIPIFLDSSQESLFIK